MNDWLAVPGFPGYEISEQGQVRSLKRGKLLKQFLARDGYLRVNLWHEGHPKHFLVHRLVAAAFLGAIPPGMQINHIDGIKTNNWAENLEIVTAQQNFLHAQRLGLARSTRGEANVKAKLVPEEVMEIRRLRKDGLAVKEIAGRFGVSSRVVYKIVRRELWGHLP